jgi:hypothetical protein
MKNIPNLILAITLIVIAWIYFNRCSSDSGIRTTATQSIIKTDTIYKEIPSEPIVISKMKTKIIYQKDTIIETQPFTAVVDTIINRDTLHTEFNFPENSFSMLLLRKPDTVMVQKITTIETPPQKSNWWEVPLSILGGAALGYAFGRIK